MPFVYKMGEQPRTSLFGSEDGGVECDRRLTYIVVVEVREGLEVALDSRPDLHLCGLGHHPDSPLRALWRDRVLHDQKKDGRLGNSVLIPVVDSIGCRAPVRPLR